jgi:hypothetical protein
MRKEHMVNGQSKGIVESEHKVENEEDPMRRVALFASVSHVLSGGRCIEDIQSLQL